MQLLCWCPHIINYTSQREERLGSSSQVLLVHIWTMIVGLTCYVSSDSHYKNDMCLRDYMSQWSIRIFMIGRPVEKRFLDVCQIFRNNDVFHFHIDYDLQSLKYLVKLVNDPENQDFLSSNYEILKRSVTRIGRGHKQSLNHICSLKLMISSRDMRQTRQWQAPTLELLVSQACPRLVLGCPKHRLQYKLSSVTELAYISCAINVMLFILWNIIALIGILVAVGL